jgi:phosphoribosylformylglycinamidine synthase subunit PurS
MIVHVHVRVMPRPGLLDPQGQAVEHALASLGFAGADNVRVGKAIDFTLEAPSVADAETIVHSMCERLLANPVTEDFVIEVSS